MVYASIDETLNAYRANASLLASAIRNLEIMVHGAPGV